MIIGIIIAISAIGAIAIFASIPQDTWKDHRTGFTGVAPPDEINEKMDCLSQGGVWEYSSCNIVRDIESQQEPKIQSCSGSAKCITEKVTKVIDGDTIYTENYKIRLSLVDTPETGESGFAQASSFTAMSCPVGSIITVDQDDLQPTDIFGRTLGKVYCDNGVLNEILLQNGLAVISAQYCHTSEFSSEPWAQKYGCAYSKTQILEPKVSVKQTTPVKSSNCDPSYPDVCITPYPPDLDCGEIPYTNFKVIGEDKHRFDGDKDGIGCEK